MTRPLVSVIVPVYNGEETIAACIASLLSLDFPAEQRELVVVDNGSTDRTPDILAQFEKRIRMVRDDHPGPAAARNAGIRVAIGDLIAFIDADCRADRQWLQHLLPPLRDPSVGIAGGRIRAFPPGNRITSFGETIHDQQRAIESAKPPYAVTANWGSRRQVLVDAGLFDERLLRGSDSELAYRIGRNYRLVYCPDALVFHRHESTLRGLFREGRDHGRGRILMRAAGVRSSLLRAERFGLPVRLARGALRTVFGPKRFEALCQAVFDLGKAVGGLAGLLPPRRSKPEGKR
jgi:glycosyltransferase involved in cell wall biosynthesis